MRHNLVTKFLCMRCGSNLEVDYEPPREIYDPASYDGITGADKVEINVGIHPCKKCYGEATQPIVSIKQALGLAENRQ